MNGGPYDFDDDYPFQGTNSVIPAQGTNTVGPLQGWDEDDDPFQGTNSIVPMQGAGGETYYVDPWALLDPDDVPMQGIPDDWDDEDIAAYQVGYMYGDPDAMQGLFKKFKAKRAEKKERKKERKDLRMENKRVRLQNRKEGKGFFQRVGGAIANAGEALKNKFAAESMLEDEGIDYSPELVDQRSAIAAESGYKMGEGGSGGGWWANLPGWQKGAMIGTGVLALAGIGLALFGGKKKGKKR